MDDGVVDTLRHGDEHVAVVFRDDAVVGTDFVDELLNHRNVLRLGVESQFWQGGRHGFRSGCSSESSSKVLKYSLTRSR